MSRAFYYATNTRMAKDIMQYLFLPATRLGAYSAIKYGSGGKIGAEAALDAADVVASVAGGVVYHLNTETFSAIEAQFLDKNARTAVAAELGKKPEELKFSDYLDSKNVIVQRELEDAKKVNKIRRVTDSLFFIPAAMYAVSHMTPGDKIKKLYQTGRLNKSAPKEGDPLGSVAIGAFNLWDTSIYGAKAAYWMYETYLVDKTAHYEIVKLDETIESTGKKFKPNDLIAVVNREREDKGLTQIKEKDERNQLWDVLQHLADKMNNDEQFGMPELMYLVGLNKVNIFELDQQGNEALDDKGERVISQQAIAQTIKEIDRVADIGLAGIGQQNHQILENAKDKGFVGGKTQLGGTMPQGRFMVASQAERNALDNSFARSSAIKSAFTGLFGEPRQTTDYISPRDGMSVNISPSK